MYLVKNIKNRILNKEIITSLIIIITAFVLDRASKITIINQQINNQEIFFVNNYLNFDLIWNTGISFGLFSQNSNTLYFTISFLIFLVIIFLIYLTYKANFLEKILYSLILGGALGNFYDRLIYFAVPDFIDIHIGDFHWFTFNIADIFITFGVIFLICKDIFVVKK